jgi:RNA 3'-terminal phosphate cyclase (ATP)
VAQTAAEDARRYLAAGVPVGECLADQLLLPMALAGGGSFLTLPLSMHSRTNIQTIRAFLNVLIRSDESSPGRALIEVFPTSPPPET